MYLLFVCQCFTLYFSAVNRCELNCQAEGDTFYYRHAVQVVDGTKCNEDGRDICVEGRCQVGLLVDRAADG